jgi:hypothetical protein
MNSQGESIGQGIERLYTANDSDIGVELRDPSYVRGMAFQDSLTHWWYVDIAAPPGQVLAVGSYVGAMRASFRSPGTPGLDVSGDGRGCNTVTGKFDVNAIAYDSEGTVTLFDAEFEQHCEGGDAALFGRIRYDALAPTVAITGAPVERTTDDSASFSFTSNAGDATFECKLDDGTFSACASSKTYSGLAEGTHTFSVRATSAGHTSAPATQTWTIDLTPPETSITAHPSNPSNQTAPAFSFGANEDGATFECKLDDAAFADCGSTQTFSGLTEGSHTLQVKDTDILGHTDASPATYTWLVDTTPPETTIVDKPASLSNETSPSFSFGSSEGGSTFECRLDGAGYFGCNNALAFSGLAQGAHTLQAWATDAAGNRDGTPAEYSWMIDSVAPQTTIVKHPANPTTSTKATFKFSSSEAGATFQCRLDAAAFSPCTTPKTYTGLKRGKKHTFQVRASDAAGNADATPAAFSWTIKK